MYSVTLNFLYRTYVAAESLLGVKMHGAQAIIRRGNEVLLIKTTYRPYWEFPGGKIEKMEAPESAAIRETIEESGILIKRIKRKLGVYRSKRFYTSVTIHVYIAEEWEDRMQWKPTREIGQRAFFALDALPEDISPATRRRIDELESHAEIMGKW